MEKKSFPEISSSNAFTGTYYNNLLIQLITKKISLVTSVNLLITVFKKYVEL